MKKLIHCLFILCFVVGGSTTAFAQLLPGSLYGKVTIGDDITYVTGDIVNESTGELYMGDYPNAAYNQLALTGGYVGNTGSKIYMTVVDNSNTASTKGYLEISGTAEKATGSTEIVLNLHAAWDGTRIDLVEALNTGSDADAFSMTPITLANGRTAVLANDVQGSTRVWYICEQPTVTTQPSTATQAKCIDTGNFPAVLTVSATGTATLTYQWYYNTTTSNTGGTAISGATSSTYTPTSTGVTAGDYYYYCIVTGSCGEMASDVSGKHTVYAATESGTLTLSGDAQVCSGVDAGILTLTGHVGTVVKWQKSIDGGTTWTDIANTATTYSPGALTQTTMFRVVVQNSICDAENSDPATITVLQTTPTITAQPSTVAQEKCVGTGNFTTLTVTATGSGTLTYQWYRNTTASNVGGTEITGATSSSYTPTSTEVGEYYYYCIVATSCGQTATNVSGKRTVYAATEGGRIELDAGSQICSGLDAGTLTLADYVGTIVKWQSSTDGGTTWTDIANTTATYSPGALAQTTQFRVVVQSGSCGTANSEVTTITVVQSLVPCIYLTTSEIVCHGEEVNFTVTPVSGGSLPAYQWKVNGVNVGTDSPMYTYKPNNGDEVYCEMTSSDACASPNTAKSQTAKINFLE